MASAGAVSAALLWFGPPGTDFAAHLYQRDLLIEHGFALWNNFWYAGRYSFVTYSLAYYPLAALLGIRLLALISVVAAALAFQAVVTREWGHPARWSARTFAVAWAATVVSAAFPFLLGAAYALAGLWCLQSRRTGRFLILLGLTFVVSPLAFLLLAVVLCGLALGQWRERLNSVPVVAVSAALCVELVLWRVFPDPGRYPFPPANLGAACAFCLLGLAATWQVERGRALRGIFGVYLVACVVAYAVPSALGENVARLRFAAIPLAALALSLRRWRPITFSVVAFALACSWNVSPLAFSVVHSAQDPSSKRAYWVPALSFLQRALTPSYRVEAVATANHWEATFLPGAGIPLARGWFRQNDFPQNAVLYEQFGQREYLRWLRRLAVRYVVLTEAPTDYSARAEAELLRTGRSGLTPVFRSATTIVYRVPAPVAIVTGPARARVVQITPAGMRIQLERPGTYRIAVRYSRYWQAARTCIAPTPDGMTRLTARRAGMIDLDFSVTLAGAFASLTGEASSCRALGSAGGG